MLKNWNPCLHFSIGIIMIIVRRFQGCFCGEYTWIYWQFFQLVLKFNLQHSLYTIFHKLSKSTNISKEVWTTGEIFISMFQCLHPLSLSNFHWFRCFFPSENCHHKDNWFFTYPHTFKYLCIVKCIQLNKT